MEHRFWLVIIIFIVSLFLLLIHFYLALIYIIMY